MTDRLNDRIAIAETKARYCRLLDTKDWDGFEQVFTPDFTQDTTESGGDRLEGRDVVVAFVRRALDKARTLHQVHSSEMTFVDDDTVDVIWSMQDRIIWPEERVAQIGITALTGWGHYHERYVREDDGVWRISRQRLSRLFVETQPAMETAQ